MSASRESRIFCIRHGRPSLRYSHTPWRWITAGELNRLFDAYDEAGLDSEWNAPRLEAMQAAADPGWWQNLLTARTISSDLPRAFETALLYTQKKPDDVPQDALYRETPLARFRWTRLKLPTVFLLTLARFGWYTGWMDCAESRRDTLARVQAAADRLEALATEQGSIALYSHGFFLWLVSRELRRRGWETQKAGPFRYLEPAEFVLR
ncbi:MAG: histidine phosphatase family protein [bacterium]|nr:histidine phosphatase family protein [bacterium]